MKKLFSIIFFLLIIRLSYSQSACPISSLGQNPSTAFPVCGTKTFTQGTVNLCGNTGIPVPACNTSGASYTNINPYWYKFTCYSSGTLNFLITPNNLGDDYDWQLFDITNSTDPDVDVFKDASLFVCCNWSGVYGLTGTADTASANNQCASPTTYATGGVSPFSKSPNLIAGHTYLLLVSHFTNTQSGYTLSFTGGTAGITDPNIPGYTSASGICGGNKIGLKLTKRILCSSIASDGSDFSLNPSSVGISGASGYGCSTSFDTDSVIVQLSGFISPGNYQLIQQAGTDGNTLLDNCQNAVPIGTSASFTIISQQLLKANIIDTVFYGCVIDTIHFAMDTAHVLTWEWIFDNSVINTTQTNPLLYYSTYGNKTAKLIVNNTVCSDSTQVTYTLNNSPSKSNFSASSNFACPLDSISFFNSSTGNIATWYWNFGNGQISTDKTPPTQTYFPGNNQLTTYTVMLRILDSSGCFDSSYQTITAVPNCYIAVPSAFTPNGDGKNDYLYPLNAYKAANLTFRVFNRFGQIVFETHDWTVKWNGTLNGIKQPAGTYVWYLEYIDTDTNRKIFLKGTTVLIR